MSSAAASRPGREKPSFDAIYAAHVSYVRSALRNRGIPERDLDDVTQDVFVVIHQRLPEYEEQGRLLAWLSTIIAKKAMAYRSKHGTRTSRIDHEADPATVADTATDQDTAQRQMVLLALEEVREDWRELLVLHAFDGISMPDIAATHGIPENTVKSRILRARNLFIAAWNRLDARMRRETGDTTPVPLFGAMEAVAAMRDTPFGAPPTAPAMPATAALSGATAKGVPMVALLSAAVIIFMLGIATGVLLVKLPVPVDARPDAVVAAPMPVAQAPSAAPVLSPSPALPANAPAQTAAAPLRDPSGIAAERSLLADAESALRAGRIDVALAALEEHSRHWHGGGLLAKRRDDLRVQALLAAGRVTEAQAAIARFASAYPGDPMVRAWH